MNKWLLDTDILSEIGKGIDPTVARNATAYRIVFGRYTLLAIGAMEIVCGFQKTQSGRRLQAFIASLPFMEVIRTRWTSLVLIQRRPFAGPSRSRQVGYTNSSAPDSSNGAIPVYQVEVRRRLADLCPTRWARADEPRRTRDRSPSGTA